MVSLERRKPRQFINLLKDTSYIFVYTERHGGLKRTSWPIRQTGVFHRYNSKADTNLWIILHPMPQSKVQERLDELVIKQAASTSLCNDWHQLHLLIISSYMNNWRWYLNDLSDEISETVSISRIRYLN